MGMAAELEILGITRVSPDEWGPREVVDRSPFRKAAAGMTVAPVSRRRAGPGWPRAPAIKARAARGCPRLPKRRFRRTQRRSGGA